MYVCKESLIGLKRLCDEKLKAVGAVPFSCGGTTLEWGKEIEGKKMWVNKNK